MERAEGGRSTDERKVSDAGDDPHVFVSTRSFQPGGSSVVPGMLPVSIGRTVSFDNRVVVHTPTDWSPRTYSDARRGPWLLLAMERRVFLRRIRKTELALGYVFSDAHRERIQRRLFVE